MTAEFAFMQEIDHKPAFNWWFKHVLKKRERMIASIRKQQTRYLKRSYKFGIECFRMWSRCMSWMPKMAIAYGQMQFAKKWRMSEWHL